MMNAILCGTTGQPACSLLANAGAAKTLWNIAEHWADVVVNDGGGERRQRGLR
jgi:hypothetical protein